MEKVIPAYYLRPHPLPLPFIKHVYAESCLNYQVVILINNTDPLILIKLIDQTHSLNGLSKYVTLKYLETYSPMCHIINCYVCNRT